jgi:hypothetical protein
MTDFDLNALVDKALASKEPDPHVIARRLVARVPAEHLRDVVAALLVVRVSLRMRMQRAGLAADHPGRDAHRSNVGGKPGASRWQRHARYCVAGEWKFYDDLSADDCDLIAADYQERADANAALAERFRETARLIRAAGAVRVADLETLPVAA